MAVRVIAHYDKVLAYLNEQPIRQAEILRQWKAEGSDETMRYMRGIVPIRTGFLRESVTRRETPQGFLVYALAPYARFVDQGTAPHWIFPRNSQVLRWFGEFEATIFARRVYHPGTKAVHFIERTKEAMRQVLRELYLAIWREQR